MVKENKSIKNIKPEDVICAALKLPIVKVNRENFLHKELINYYPEETVKIAIDKNPAYAGIPRETINQIAKQVINYETNKVTANSFVAGIPGGLAMAATIPADLAQYYGFMIKLMQKIAYLYGFDDFDLNEEKINDETMNQILIFLGVMFGVQGANTAVKKIAESASNKIMKSLAQKALTKGTIYPIVKKIAQSLGIRMTKEIFAKGVSKVVPVIGGVVSGGLSYATFKPCAKKLQNSFMKLPLSDPDFYKNPEKYNSDDSVIDINIDDMDDNNETE